MIKLQYFSIEKVFCEYFIEVTRNAQSVTLIRYMKPSIDKLYAIYGLDYIVSLVILKNSLRCVVRSIVNAILNVELL